MNDNLRRTIRSYAESADGYATFSRDYETFPGLLPIAEEFLRSVSPERLILDSGCGCGRDALRFAGCGRTIVALDACQPLLAEWSASATICQIAGDFLYLPMSDATFGGVWACASFVHLSEDQLGRAFAESLRVLRSGGPTFATFRRSPEAGWETSNVIPGERWMNSFVPEQVAAAMMTAGYVSPSWVHTGLDGSWFCVRATAP